MESIQCLEQFLVRDLSTGLVDLLEIPLQVAHSSAHLELLSSPLVGLTQESLLLRQELLERRMMHTPDKLVSFVKWHFPSDTHNESVVHSESNETLSAEG